MAENTGALCSAVAEILEVEVGIPTQYVSGIPWQERERLFDLGEIQILWLCGLPYVNKADLADSVMELLPVPVPSGPRWHMPNWLNLSKPRTATTTRFAAWRARQNGFCLRRVYVKTFAGRAAQSIRHEGE